MKTNRKPLREELQDHLDTIREVPEGVRSEMRVYRLDLEAIRRDSDLTAEAKQRRSAALRDAVRAERDSMDASRQHAYIIMLERAREVLAAPDAADTTEALLHELQDQRAWARCRALLDAGRSPEEVIAAVGRAGDVAGSRALRAELDSYMDARGASTQQREAASRLLDQHEALPPAKQEARNLLAEVEKMNTAAVSDLNYLAHELDGGAPYSVIVDADGGAMAVDG